MIAKPRHYYVYRPALWLAAAAVFMVAAAAAPAAASAYTVENHNTPATGQLVLSPPKTELDVNPGEVTSSDIVLANQTSNTESVQFSVEDFTGSKDPSQEYVFDGDQDSPWSARHWLQPELSSITLKPGEVLTFQVKIKVPQNAEPGGHYAVVFATARNVDAGANKQGSSVDVTPRIGAPFLFRVAGDINENGTLNPPEIPSFVEYGPINIGLVFNNKGNIHENPHGKVYISNMLGQTVKVIDVANWTVYPDAAYRLLVNWPSHFLFGRYTVRAEISYGSGDKQIIMSSSFWAIPWKIILAVISSLIIIVILLSWATRGRRQAKAARQAELDQFHANYAAVTEAALEEPQETETTLAETGEPAAGGPERPPAPPEPVSSHMPLNELFPSMNDNRMIDIDDDETRKLLRTMIDNEMDLARAFITEGKNDEARRELLEARGAAQKLGLLSEVGLIDDMLDWV